MFPSSTHPPNQTHKLQWHTRLKNISRTLSLNIRETLFMQTKILVITIISIQFYPHTHLRVYLNHPPSSFTWLTTREHSKIYFYTLAIPHHKLSKTSRHVNCTIFFNNSCIALYYQIKLITSSLSQLIGTKKSLLLNWSIF